MGSLDTKTTTGEAGTHGTTGNTLPASWYREEGMYELEKRAIFSKRWMCVTHALRLKEVGQFVNFDIAGYKFFVIRDRQNEVKAFLNVCRHRAYPIIEKESGEGGKVSILACKYHGTVTTGEVALSHIANCHAQVGLMACPAIWQKRLASRRWETSIKRSIRCTQFIYGWTGWASSG